jgi:RNA polymerase sigma factor (TIGR02999 family)
MTDPQVTRLLNGAVSRPAAELLSLVYDELRRMAQVHMQGERRAHTLTATALVHEAYVRLVGDDTLAWANRAHFFYAAGEAMRRILVEHARARSRLKRGGGIARSPLEIGSVADLAPEQDPDQMIAFDDVFCRLEAHEPRFARVVRLRFFAGLSVEQTAQALGVSERTVNNDWAYARAWLARELQRPAE